MASPSKFPRGTCAQNFIREVRKGREKQATTAFFEIPGSAVQSILTRVEANYDIPFDNDQWRLERAKVDAGEKELPPLNAQSGHPPAPTRGPEQQLLAGKQALGAIGVLERSDLFMSR